MPLSDEQRVRYARHLLLPELGEAGQLRLLASRVRFAQDADRGAREVAEQYLRRAGVRVGGDGDAHAHDCEHEDEAYLVELQGLSSGSALGEAGRVLVGAFAAVETIKALAGLGRPGQLDRDLLSAEEV